MKKYVLTAIAFIAVLSFALYLDAQPAGAGGGAAGGGMRNQGQRAIRTVRPRPEKKARLETIAELEKQIAELKKAIEEAPAEDPNIANLTGKDLTKFMDTYTVESNAINQIQATLTSLRIVGVGFSGMFATGIDEDDLKELSDLAKKDNATKTAARLDTLIQQAQQRTTRRGNRGAGGSSGADAGMMGGGSPVRIRRGNSER